MLYPAIFGPLNIIVAARRQTSHRSHRLNMAAADVHFLCIKRRSCPSPNCGTPATHPRQCSYAYPASAVSASNSPTSSSQPRIFGPYSCCHRSHKTLRTQNIDPSSNRPNGFRRIRVPHSGATCDRLRQYPSSLQSPPESVISGPKIARIHQRKHACQQVQILRSLLQRIRRILQALVETMRPRQVQKCNRPGNRAQIPRPPAHHSR